MESAMIVNLYGNYLDIHMKHNHVITNNQQN